MLLSGLLGYPVSHSVSPLIHSSFMEHFRIEGKYELFSVPPEEVEVLLGNLLETGYTGLNITVPHKKTVFHLCNSTGPDALSAGAVNTVVLSGGGIHGANTDVAGFRKMAADLPEPFFVLGDGGAAAAVRTALASRRFITVRRGEGLPLENLPSYATVVNATPLGWCEHDRFPFDLPPEWVFADLNYNPGWLWRNQLEKKSVRVITGEVMLVEQAACSFSMWTGYTPPEELKKTVLKQIRIEFDEHHKQ